MRGIFSITVENRSGVLSKIAGLFARRGFNIEQLTVGATEDPTVSSITIISEGDERTMEQIEKQLNKQIDVIKVRHLNSFHSIEREGVIIKVNYTRSNRLDIMEICSIIGARIVYMGTQSLVLEYFGDPEMVQSLITNLRPMGIQEVARTGELALQKELK